MKRFFFWLLICLFLGVLVLPSLTLVGFFIFVPRTSTFLAITVTDEDGIVHDATVTLVRGSGRGAYAQATHPDIFGIARFKVIAKGSYEVFVKRPGCGKSRHRIYIRGKYDFFKVIRVKRNPALYQYGTDVNRRMLQAEHQREGVQRNEKAVLRDGFLSLP